MPGQEKIDKAVGVVIGVQKKVLTIYFPNQR